MCCAVLRWAMLCCRARHRPARPARREVCLLLCWELLASKTYTGPHAHAAPRRPDPAAAHWLLPSHTRPMFIKQTAESKLRMLTSVWNVCDLLSFAPPLLETLLRATGTSIRWAACAASG